MPIDDAPFQAAEAEETTLPETRCEHAAMSQRHNRSRRDEQRGVRDTADAGEWSGERAAQQCEALSLKPHVLRFVA